jgi:2-keto-4-pentenoate hydratase
VIELPFSLKPLMGDRMLALDAIAANFGSNRYLVGRPVAPKTIANFDALAISLQRDGRTFHETTGGDVLGGQAQNLMTLINQIVDDGHVIHRGDVILCGALGGAQPGEKGRYTATFGPLGTLTFELQ